MNSKHMYTCADK